MKTGFLSHLFVATAALASATIAHGEYYKGCGVLWKSHDQCSLQIRQGKTLRLENLRCEFYSEGARYCAGGYLHRDFDGKWFLRVLLWNEE